MNFRVHLLVFTLTFVSFLTVSGFSTDSTLHKFEPHDSYAWCMDSLWMAEQFDSQLLELDTSNLNIFGYAKDEIPVFSDSIISLRLEKLNEQTPFQLVFNRHVAAQIKIYSQRYRRHVSTMLGKSNFYFPLFEEILDRYDLPLEFKYLAVVESALKPHARSRSAATGLWQFMYATGKIYDLNVTSYIDERSDPIQSTIAACDYFTFLYKMFNDWELVLAAYNGGPGYVSRAMTKHGVSDFWSLRPFLRKETQNYVPKFIAVNYIMNYASEHNIYPIEYPYLPSHTDTVSVSQSLKFIHLSETLNIPMEVLRELNPIYKRDLIPVAKGKKQLLTLPVEKMASFVKNEPLLYDYAVKDQKKYVESDEPIVHRVVKGEYLGKIAEKYGVRVSQIKSWNKLKSTNLKIGQKLVVYVGTRYSPSQAKKSAVSFSGKTTNYTIKSGDTLWKIANLHDGVTVRKLEEINNISSSDLKPGMVIKIPKTS